MQITIHRINVPAMSTMGYGEGLNEDGDTVFFAGDHRPMRAIGEAMADHSSEDPLVVTIEPWQVLRRRPRALV